MRVEHNIREPLPGSVHAEEARDFYLRVNGFALEDYQSDWVRIKVGPLPAVYFPNTRVRKQIVPLHDLHHVATGYGTDIVGEAEVGAWELRAGCTTFIAYLLNGMAAATGMLVSPRRVLRAFRGAAGHTTLYKSGLSYAEVMKLEVGELRRLLGLPEEGVAEHPIRLNTDAERRLAAA
jgi:hypothetical protein